MTTTPWWSCLNLRPEIVDAAGNINDVQMSLFRAVHEPSDTVYADVQYYSDITHPTSGLLELMGSIAVRMAAPNRFDTTKAVWRGDQGMGGGKSHAQVGLFHMAHNPDAFFNTDLGKDVLGRAGDIAGEIIPTDLAKPVVVVLPCDEMDPFHPNPDLEFDGPGQTLAERWLWRLAEGNNDLFKKYRGELGTSHGVQEAIEAVGRPVLTLVDEVLNYLRKATADPERQERAVQDVAFLDDLMDATNKVDHAAMVIVMIASDIDVVTMTDFGENFRTELEERLTRFGRTIATTSGGDFADIIRRRLFSDPPPVEAVDETVSRYSTHAVQGWQNEFASFSWWNENFSQKVERSYPFHPALVEMVEREWSQRAGFQRVRSTIQIFAAAVWVWLQRTNAEEWAPPLIGLGDLPLSDTKVRESLLNSGVIPEQKTVTNYREIASNDVVDPDDNRGAARQIDLDRSEGLLSQINPRAAERIATCMYVASLAPRAQGATGATEAELRIAAFVPESGCDLGEVDAILTTLQSPERGIATLDIKPGKGGQPRRLLMSTSQTLQMFFRTQRQSVQTGDVARVLSDETQAEIKKGPFGRTRFLSADDYELDGVKGRDLVEKLIAIIEAAGIDDSENRLFVLDPSAFTLLNGVDTETWLALHAAFGVSGRDSEGIDGWVPSPMAVAYASSSIFSVVNFQRKKAAVGAASDFVAWQRVCEISNVSSDEGLKDQAQAQMRSSKESMRSQLRKAFQHIVYLNHSREVTSLRLDKENQTALDGALVWKLLAEEEKTFDEGEFTATALLHNLRDGDFGKSLSAIRNDFYRSPRLPLLYGGDGDLKQALYFAYLQKDVVFLSQAGEPMEPTRPGDINIMSKGILLERAQEIDVVQPAPPTPGGEGGPSGGGAGRGGQPGGGVQTPPPDPEVKSGEEIVTLTLMGSAFSSKEEQEAGYNLFNIISAAVDNADVSFGKFSIELTLPTAVADDVARFVEDLGVSINRKAL